MASLFKFNPGASAPRKKLTKQRAEQGRGEQKPADRTPSLSTSLSLLQSTTPQTAMGRSSAQPRNAEGHTESQGETEGPAQSFFGGGPSYSHSLSLPGDGAAEGRRVRRVSFGAPQVCNFSLKRARMRARRISGHSCCSGRMQEKEFEAETEREQQADRLSVPLSPSQGGAHIVDYAQNVESSFLRLLFLAFSCSRPCS